MRIGILTLPLHTNYGGILQAYALQTVLERMGHQVVVFDRPLEKSKLPLWKMPYSYTKRFIKKYFFGKKDEHIFWERYVYHCSLVPRQYTQRFINQRIHRYIIRSFNDIKEEDFDAIVVGSDQIWREIYFKISFGQDSDFSNAFLAFTKGWKIKRIAYAASFGKDDIKEYSAAELHDIRNAIRLFNSVSVREESGVTICKKEFGVDAQWVLDPTLLLTHKDYEALGPNIQDSNGNSLMFYVLDDNVEKDELAQKIANDKGLRVLRANGRVEDTSAPIEEKIQPPVENWLGDFVSSSYVITDSFHACVFSILFHRQFTVIANKERGYARFSSLLKLFGLESRLISSPSEYKPQSDIDYSFVDKILDIQREKAMSFLEEALGDKVLS